MAAVKSDWVIVSGGSGSLGRASVAYFLSLGGPVLSLDRAVEGKSDNDSDLFVSRAVDLTCPMAVKEAVEVAIPKGEKIGVLVNAVGQIANEPVVSFRGGSLIAHTVESWRNVIEANLTAPFVVAAYVATRMARTGGGVIINFSSIAGRGNVGQAAYSAAKAGVEGLTRAMAVELGPMGIRVNAIAPGFIDVPSTRAALTEDQLEAIAARTPSRRLGNIDDVLHALGFLTGNQFVNGVILDVNGGLRI